MTTRISAFDRHGDEWTSLQTGSLAKFFSTLYRKDLPVIDCYSIYDFRDARYRCAVDRLHSKPLRDQPEKFLNALLGFLTLLNQPMGGSNSTYTYVPSQEDRSCFELLITSSISQLNLSLTVASSTVIESLRVWSRWIRTYAQEHQLSVTTHRKKAHAYSPGLEEAVTRQHQRARKLRSVSLSSLEAESMYRASLKPDPSSVDQRTLPHIWSIHWPDHGNWNLPTPITSSMKWL